jgi:TPR repeat protein
MGSMSLVWRAQVERTRLAAGPLWRAGQPSREQQVLHFQWFADLGSAEAQRTLGQMLNAGGQQRDPGQALRYFRCARQGS